MSDDRVSLPEGPGSLEGVGENVDADPNMGAMRYSIPIDVPEGFPGATPSLALGYNSGGGGSVVGMGWSMGAPAVERMTYRGLPRYDRSDDFSADGGQLVRLPNTDPPQYRSRYEGSFTRYTWMEMGDGDAGYWVAERPNGSTEYYGATQDGVLVPAARVTGPDGTFRYMLVDRVDVYGHRLHHSYIKDGPVSLLSLCSYLFTVGPNTPTYEVAFDYEERLDDTGLDYLSDAKPGFNELLTRIDRRRRVSSS
ncbi:MAG: SpvB/TcaC N-terminal domain-containing protein, partial [Myxococcota bacterium]